VIAASEGEEPEWRDSGESGRARERARRRGEEARQRGGGTNAEMQIFMSVHCVNFLKQAV